ncbi:MAG: squalene synthase HpnC [endosymbiont of Galathealinum brachiosum]|uniref:Squalene synthase HpnC n=1 Tax=endosymbiont of Galathealinum brachiosum TaxID=2200906 RepID=A0A370DI89_9GAMM|nr:MAG: squalene synthase HpnC [endosymbiont of Galathealinum brachiosum]
MNTKQAYKHCLNISKNHYENFPVASWVLPKRMRLPTAAIYAFARRADDFADEGGLTDEERLNELDKLAQQVEDLFEDKPGDDPVFIALADCVKNFSLPKELFLDLINAFKQDVTTNRYADFGELMQYCRRSANPVGRLMLHLYGLTDRKSLGQSDAICTSLQLINFYQDMAQDYNELGRIYIPQDEIRASFVNDTYFKNSLTDGPMILLMRKQYERAHKLLQGGAPLGKTLKGRFGFEIRLIIAAGSNILLKLDKQTDDVFSRPRLNFQDWFVIFWKALRAK